MPDGALSASSHHDSGGNEILENNVDALKLCVVNLDGVIEQLAFMAVIKSAFPDPFNAVRNWGRKPMNPL